MATEFKDFKILARIAFILQDLRLPFKICNIFASNCEGFSSPSPGLRNVLIKHLG